MNESKTPKIVVGVGLVAVYAGLAFYFLRDTPAVNVAQDAAAEPFVPMADVPVPAPAIAPAITDIPMEVAGQPAVATAAPSPADRSTASLAASGRQERPDEPTAAIASAGRQDPDREADPSPDPVDASVSMVDESASTVADLPSSSQAGSEASGSDSQITAEVRTQIAAVAPASTIEVTTTDGVVELSGSVPSHEEVNRVLIAAQGVAHVRSVDATALMVGN